MTNWLYWVPFGAASLHRTYSPGVLTGLLLYVPLTVYGYRHFLRTGQASVATAVIAFAVGASYQLWVGNALHNWRVRRART